MIQKDLKNFFLTIALTALIIGAVYGGVFYLSKTGEIRIVEGGEVPYTITQVEAMMRYHGAIVARFDGKRWCFLKDGKWIAIENGNALNYALKEQPKASQSL